MVRGDVHDGERDRGLNGIVFGPDTLRNLDLALDREWLLTSESGAFAFGTISGINTRRYHGLLVASTGTLASRALLLAKIEETLKTADGPIDLASNCYPGVVHPGGYRLIEEFRLDPTPTWIMRAGSALLRKSVSLARTGNAVCVEYELLEGDPCRLQLRPLVAFRDYHSLGHAHTPALAAIVRNPGSAVLRPYGGLPGLSLKFADGTPRDESYWCYRLQYPRERERGLDFEEDLFLPFAIDFQLRAGESVDVVCAVEGESASEFLPSAPSSRSLQEALPRAATQFFIRREAGPSIMAGYPWFTDWGRDTLISLPAFLPVAGVEWGRETLATFASYLRDGLIPNRFPDQGAEPEYNSTDASLWFFDAVRAVAEASNAPTEIYRQFFPALEEMIQWRERGTRYGIRLAANGLIESGEEGVQLTWMDARVDGRVITPRNGQPVEIQALWFQALCIARDAARLLDRTDAAARFDAMAQRAAASFNELFWSEDLGYFYDVIDGDRRDASLRPNQLIALSVPPTLVAPDRALRVLDAVERELLTLYGLRTLSPRDPQYRGRCEGGVRERDEAYHQGTVWPWLLGPYAEAVLKFRGAIDSQVLLRPFETHLLEAGLGQISEIFDGDAPHTPRGCVAQAWSVGALLRVLAL